jgi:hypothetical protein
MHPQRYNAGVQHLLAVLTALHLLVSAANGGKPAHIVRLPPWVIPRGSRSMRRFQILPQILL